MRCSILILALGVFCTVNVANGAAAAPKSALKAVKPKKTSASNKVHPALKDDSNGITKSAGAIVVGAVIFGAVHKILASMKPSPVIVEAPRTPSLPSKSARIAVGLFLAVQTEKFLTKSLTGTAFKYTPVLGLALVYLLLNIVNFINAGAANSIVQATLPFVDFTKTAALLFSIPALVSLPWNAHLFSPKVVLVTLLSTFATLAFTTIASDRLQTIVGGSDAAPAAPTATGPRFEIPANRPLMAATLFLVISAISGPGSSQYAIFSKAFGGASTAGSYLLANKSTPSKLREVVHPLVIAAAFALVFQYIFSLATKQTFAATVGGYYGSGKGVGDTISYFLGPLLITTGIQFFHYRSLISSNLLRLVSSSGLSAIFGTLISAVLSRLLSLDRGAAAASIERFAVLPGMTTSIGSDYKVFAVITAWAGIAVATYGDKVLAKLGVKSSSSVSAASAVGTSATRFGVASTAGDPEKFTVALLSSILTGLWTVGLLSINPVRSQLMSLAGCPVRA